VADLAGVEHNLDDPEYAEIFAQNARLAGMVDLDEYSMSDLRAKIAGSIGIDPERLEKAILPMERVYAVETQHNPLQPHQQIDDVMQNWQL